MSRRYLFSLFVYFSYFLSSFAANAQKKDSTWIGAIHGSVRDTTHNYFMQSATVSVYKAADNSLLAYTLTNSLGEFHVGALPTNLMLLVKISFIGYETFSSRLKISLDDKTVNLGEVDLRTSGKEIDSVVVTPPPVRMHGDTLEFSAAAFDLDKNAVAEDLLKKLPGVILWGDGSITVNGRQISNLLVDGKPFFGGDNRVATQNIPKSAIDKVQVYQEAINPYNPLDSTMSINIKLRKSGHSGYFGALSAGLGNNERYELSANNSIFTPRNQFAIVGQANNINRLANNISTLLSNSTFKGVGARVEYQPDFSLPGSNKQTSAGFLFTHDFIPDFNQFKQNRFGVNSFYNHINNNTLYNTQTTTSLGIDSTLKQTNVSNSTNDNSNFTITPQYSWRKNYDSLLVFGKVDIAKSLTETLQQNNVNDPKGTALSFDNQNDSLTKNQNALNFETIFFHQGFKNSNTRKLTSWSVDYTVNWQRLSSNRALGTIFRNYSDTSLNLDFDRHYEFNDDHISQGLNMQLGDFSAWLWGDSRTLSPFNIVIKNNLKFDIDNLHHQVEDKDSPANSYAPNSYLTSVGSYKVLTESPDLWIGRNFPHLLVNRYQKDLSIYIDAKMQERIENNSSTHSFQNYSSSYSKFIPDVGISYSDFQYGEYLNRFNFDISVFSIYPTPDQRVPLVDSATIYSLQEGNISLKPSDNYQALFRFRHDVYGSRNTFFYGAFVRGGITQNYIGDSLAADLAGRYAYYPVNLSGHRYITGNIFLGKAYILGQHQIQINIMSNVERRTDPGYISYQSSGTSGYNRSQIFTNSDTMSIFYTYKDIIALNLLENIYVYHSQQEGFTNVAFNNTQTLTKCGIGVNITKKLFVTSNVTFTHSTYSQSSSINYTIWNASAAYRFLKGNNLELKISGLDLLNQNKGIVNTGGNSSFTYGTVNMLHQYFMATVSYFPRKFGKKSSSHLTK